jgi:nicotinamide riboside transporter PnuC
MEWTWAITVASIIGTVANIYKRRWCFWVWLCTNSTWSVYDFSIQQYAQSALFAVYTGLAVWGLICWKRETGGVRGGAATIPLDKT